jgi:hypothetical protein
MSHNGLFFTIILLMSAVEMAVEKVRQLDDARARRLLEWLETQEKSEVSQPPPLGAMAMLGFARAFHPQPRATSEWMAELRSGERD